jgi:hypothetical protein
LLPLANVGGQRAQEFLEGTIRPHQVPAAFFCANSGCEQSQQKAPLFDSIGDGENGPRWMAIWTTLPLWLRLWLQFFEPAICSRLLE